MRPVLPFKLDGREHPVTCVLAGRIVVHLDAVEHVSPRLIPDPVLYFGPPEGGVSGLLVSRQLASYAAGLLQRDPRHRDPVRSLLQDERLLRLRELARLHRLPLLAAKGF